MLVDSMDLDIAIEAAWPEATDWEGTSLRASKAACQVAPELTHPRISASVLFADDAEVRALNRQWRKKDKPTNVLSFPMLERETLLALPQEGPPELIGDIVLALETCAREAAEKGVSLETHATHLLIHGLLHLAGHDHVESDEQAKAMEKLETNALALLGMEDPYGEPDADLGA